MFEIPADWEIAYEARVMTPCTDRALVLTSLDIPNQTLYVDGRCLLAVPNEFLERARFEIWQYEQENEAPPPRPPRVDPAPQDPLPGILAYVGLIGLFAWLAGEAAFSRDWLAAGRMDGELFRSGELWRAVTALTLHLDLRHLLGNMGFGSLFGYFAGRLLGPGVAWLIILGCAVAGNAGNALLLDPGHRSIGASTAVFAALGLVSGFVWRGRLMAQDRWPYRLGPIVGGIALLAYTGTGGENTDIGAHLAGFVCGLGAGMLLVPAAEHLDRPRLQAGAGAAALLVVTGAWLSAFF